MLRLGDLFHDTRSYSRQEKEKVTMTLRKRLLFILGGLLLAFAVSYFIFTATQI